MKAQCESPTGITKVGQSQTFNVTNCDGNHCLNQDIVYEAPNQCSPQPQLGKIYINYKSFVTNDTIFVFFNSLILMVLMLLFLLVMISYAGTLKIMIAFFSIHIGELFHLFHL